jgi:hypothetical protein
LVALCDALKERLVEAQSLQNQLAMAVVEQALRCRVPKFRDQSQAGKQRLKTTAPYPENEQISMAAEP